MAEQALRVAEPCIKALILSVSGEPPRLCVIVASRFGPQRDQFMVVGDLALGEQSMWKRNFRALAYCKTEVSALTGQNSSEVELDGEQVLAGIKEGVRGNFVTDTFIISCACSNERFSENISMIVAACYLTVLEGAGLVPHHGDDTPLMRERPD